MTDPKYILIEAPSEATILAARHLGSDGPVSIGTVVNNATRSAINTVLRYISKAHNAPAVPRPADMPADVEALIAEFLKAQDQAPQGVQVLDDAPEPQGEATILAELRQTRAQRNTARARIALAKNALAADGYFTPDQIGDDIAPRITERLTAYRDQLAQADPADVDLAAAEARGETVRVAALLREILARYRPLTDHKGRVVGWTALGVTPADFDRWSAVAFTAAGAAEEELSALVSGHLDALDAQAVTPATDVRCEVTNVPHGPHTWNRGGADEAHCPGVPGPLTRRPSTPASGLPRRHRNPAADTLSPAELHGTTAEIAVTCGTCSQPITSTISDHLAEAHGMPKIWPGNSPLLDHIEGVREQLVTEDPKGFYGNGDLKPLDVPAAIVAQIRTELDVCRAKIERLTAGEEPGYASTVNPTPGQWIWRWNQAAAPERLEVASNILRAFDQEEKASATERQLRDLAAKLADESPWDANAPEIGAEILAILDRNETPRPELVHPAAEPQASAPPEADESAGLTHLQCRSYTDIQPHPAHAWRGFATDPPVWCEGIPAAQPQASESAREDQ